MAKLVIGRYLDSSTFYHKIHPLLKIVLFFLTTILTLISSNINAYLIFILFLFFSIIKGKIGIKNYLQAIKPVIAIFIWTLVFQILFNRQGEVLLQLGFLKLYSQTLINAFIVFLRMFILISIATILTLTTSPIELTHGFEDFFKPLKYLKVPVDTMALILSIALRFIPLFFDEVERIEIAQKSKGYDVEDLGFFEKFKYYGLLLIPLLLSAVKKSEDIADAMEIRGYGIGIKQSRFREYHIKKEDIILLVSYLIIIIFAGLIAI